MNNLLTENAVIRITKSGIKRPSSDIVVSTQMRFIQQVCGPSIIWKNIARYYIIYYDETALVFVYLLATDLKTSLYKKSENENVIYDIFVNLYEIDK